MAAVLLQAGRGIAGWVRGSVVDPGSALAMLVTRTFDIGLRHRE
jgi:hypothetical protein